MPELLLSLLPPLARPAAAMLLPRRGLEAVASAAAAFLCAPCTASSASGTEAAVFARAVAALCSGKLEAASHAALGARLCATCAAPCTSEEEAEVRAQELLPCR